MQLDYYTLPRQQNARGGSSASPRRREKKNRRGRAPRCSLSAPGGDGEVRCGDLHGQERAGEKFASARAFRQPFFPGPCSSVGERKGKPTGNLCSGRARVGLGLRLRPRRGEKERDVAKGVNLLLAVTATRRRQCGAVPGGVFPLNFRRGCSICYRDRELKKKKVLV